MKNSIKERLLNVGNIIAAIWFLIVAVIFFFTPGGPFSIPRRIMAIPIVVIIGLSAYFAGNLKLFKRLKDVQPFKIYAVSALIMLAVELLIVFSAGYHPINDSSYLDTICRNFVEGRGLYDGLNKYHEFYLDRYSNNWGIFLVQVAVYKTAYAIFGRIPDITISLVNVVMLQLSYFLLFKLSQLILDNKKQKLLCLLMMPLNPVLYAYSCVFYTDTLSMPFVLGAIYLGVKAMKSQSKKGFALYTIGSALCIGFGYTVKGSVAVIGVALVIYSLLKFSIKRTVALAAAIVIGFVSANTAVKEISYATGAVSEQGVEQHGFPMSHWIMMGLKDRGGYDEDSFRFTFGYQSKDDRKIATKEKIREMLSDYGFSGLMGHFYTKMRYTWYGGAYLATIQYDSSTGTAVKSFFKGSAPFVLWFHAFQCFMVFYMTISFVASAIKRKTDMTYIVRITVLGLCMFLMLWETRSRYMINMLPLFFIISADGVEQFAKFTAPLFKKIKRSQPADSASAKE